MSQVNINIHHPQRSAFTFDTDVAGFVGASILGAIVSAVTLGLFYPYALVLLARWAAKNARIDGRPLRFTGTATGLGR